MNYIKNQNLQFDKELLKPKMAITIIEISIENNKKWYYNGIIESIEPDKLIITSDIGVLEFKPEDLIRQGIRSSTDKVYYELELQ